MKLLGCALLLFLPLTHTIITDDSQALFTAPNSYPIPTALLEAISTQAEIVEELQPVELKTEIPAFDVQMGSTAPGDLGRLSMTTDRGDIDDLGDPSSKHSLRFLLASSFEKGVMGSGKIWVIPPSAPADSSVLIAGLGLSLGLCYDSEHDFLYVFDSTTEDKGRIFQYKAERSEKKLKIRKAEYTQVYEGDRITACSVDEYSNLYFAQAGAINFVSYLDLWTGFKNQYEVMYTGKEDKVTKVVDFIASGFLNLYWVNGEGEQDLVVKAPGRYRFGRPPDLVAYTVDVISIAADEDFLYKGFKDGSIAAVEKSSGISTAKASVSRPEAMCVGGSTLYIADTKSEVIYTLGADETLGVPVPMVRLVNLSDMECVLVTSSAAILAVSWLLSS